MRREGWEGGKGSGGVDSAEEKEEGGDRRGEKRIYERGEERRGYGREERSRRVDGRQERRGREGRQAPSAPSLMQQEDERASTSWS